MFGRSSDPNKLHILPVCGGTQTLARQTALPARWLWIKHVTICFDSQRCVALHTLNDRHNNEPRAGPAKTVVKKEIGHAQPNFTKLDIDK